MTIDIDK